MIQESWKWFCIDLILKNKPHSFQNSYEIKTVYQIFKGLQKWPFKHLDHELQIIEITNISTMKVIEKTYRRKSLILALDLMIVVQWIFWFMSSNFSLSASPSLHPSIDRSKLWKELNFVISSERMKTKKRYSLHRYYCVSLLRKTKENTRETFWRTVKRVLLDKILSKKQIILIENDKTISEDSGVAQTLISFLPSIVSN